MSIIINMSNIGAQLINADQQAIAIVSDVLSYDVEGAQFMTGFKMGDWNGKKTFLQYPDLMFHAGFVPMVKSALAEKMFAVTVQDFRKKVEIKSDDIELKGIELRDYQLEAVAALEREGRGILQIATGGGKTEVAIAATKRFGLKTLFVTHKLDLVRQTRNRYQKRLGRAVGMISEGEYLPSEITVATVQTLIAHWTNFWTVTGWKKRKNKPLERVEVVARGLDEKQARHYATKTLKLVSIDSVALKHNNVEVIKNFLASIEFVIFDEAHKASSDSFFKIAFACSNAFYRVGLTATPLMKSSHEDNLKLIATTGNVIYRITNKYLIDRGILAKPYFRFHQVPEFVDAYGRSPKRLSYPEVYKIGIVNNAVRNQMIVEDTRDLVAQGRPTVVLVKEILHGDILFEIFRQAGINCFWIAGRDDADTRAQAIEKLQAGEIDVLIASTILDEGIDSDAISAIILAGGEKSKISLFQRVGRSVREKKGDQLDRFGNTSKIIDYIDCGDKRLMKHSALRYSTVASEEGWVVEAIETWNERLTRMSQKAA